MGLSLGVAAPFADAQNVLVWVSLRFETLKAGPQVLEGVKLAVSAPELEPTSDSCAGSAG